MQPFATADIGWYISIVSEMKILHQDSLILNLLILKLKVWEANDALKGFNISSQQPNYSGV